MQQSQSDLLSHFEFDSSEASQKIRKGVKKAGKASGTKKMYHDFATNQFE